MKQDSNSQKTLLDNQEAKLTSFLKAVPYLVFSDTDLTNIAGRFNISIEELKSKIVEFKAKR